MEKNVTVYSTPTCHFCQMTREYLEENKIEYTDYNVAEDAEKRQEMMQKTGQMGVPVVVIGDDILVGFDKNRLASLLGLPT